MFRYVDEDRDRLRIFLPWVDGTRSVEDEYGYLRMTRENWEQHQLFDFHLAQRCENNIHKIFPLLAFAQKVTIICSCTRQKERFSLALVDRQRS